MNCKTNFFKFAAAVAACFGIFAEADGGSTYVEGWTAAPMTKSSASVSAEGTLVYAYAMYDCTANGVSFVGTGTGGLSADDCVTAFTSSGRNTTSAPPSDTESGDYTKLLTYGWWESAGDREFTLKNLTEGKLYLVQIIGHRSDYTTQYGYVSGCEDQKCYFGGTGWEYGGSLTRIFTASGDTETFIVKYNDAAYINAIQVRELQTLPSGTPVIENFTVSKDKTGNICVSGLIDNAAAAVKVTLTAEGYDPIEIDLGDIAAGESFSRKIGGGDGLVRLVSYLVKVTAVGEGETVEKSTENPIQYGNTVVGLWLFVQ